MGANITPTMKNNGRTVFGVKMGLSQHCQHSSNAIYSCWAHTAMLSVAAAGMRCL